MHGAWRQGPLNGACDILSALYPSSIRTIIRQASAHFCVFVNLHSVSDSSILQAWDLVLFYT